MLHIIEHSLTDTLKVIPFLFLTYLLMEYLEHRTEDKIQTLVKRAGKLGPIWGGAVGVIPQCGFSTAASGLYAGRVISLGTLLAVYLSSSDEMLPILISEKTGFVLIVKILLLKAGIGMAAGFTADLFQRRKKEDSRIRDICEKDHCRCEQGIVRSALMHTLKITGFILLINFGLNLLMHYAGEEMLASILRDRKILGPVLGGLVGMIPNCVSSILITRLYLEGAMHFGSMMAGLLTNAGVGILVLFRMNPDRRENLKILAILYSVGVIAGILL